MIMMISVVCIVEDVFYVVWQSKKITIPFKEEITKGKSLICLTIPFKEEITKGKSLIWVSLLSCRTHETSYSAPYDLQEMTE